ncbi:hypothetical protein D3C81_1268080 [compost metagenome]
MLNHHFVVKFKRQTHGFGELCFAGHFANANGRALVRRLYEERQAELRSDLGKGVALAIGARERHKRRDVQPGVTQQAFGHVFIHASRRAKDIGADERQVRHTQHPLQGTVFAQGAVYNRENHVNLRQRLRIPRVNQLALHDARYGGNADL